MFIDNQNLNSEESHAEAVLPYRQLRGFIEKLLKKRVNTPSDVEDISQDVFRRSWQWINKYDKKISFIEWKPLLAKIAFNEIRRFYSKKTTSLEDSLEETHNEIRGNRINPQFIFEIAEALLKLPFRQRLAVVLHDGEILPYLKVVLSNRHIAELLEVSEEGLLSIESEIPMSDTQIKEIIEILTQKPCKSSIRDERCKGRKLLKDKLFGK